MTTTQVSFPPLFPVYTPELIHNPYAVYARMRASGPVLWDGGSWYLVRYAEVQASLRDPRLAAGRLRANEQWLEANGLGPLFHAHQKMMLFSDPPDHTRLRSLVNKAFTPRAVESMRAAIQRIVDGLLDQVQAAGHMDVIRDLAYPLPVTVIAEMLGVPTDEREQFKRWSEDVAAFIGGTTAPEIDVLSKALHSVVEMSQYFAIRAAERRAAPRNDLLSALALAEEQGDRLSSEELVANCILLLVAGHETTTNLIGNGLLALLQHPDQLHLLRERPDLIGNAVEELLRYDSPVQGTSRLATTNVTIGGYTIPAGSHVMMMIGAANRDPEQFADPERLDIQRHEVRHLSFSHGPHFCVGAPLARLEGQIALATLLRRMPNLQLAGGVTWRDNFTLRGLTALHVSF